MAKIRVCDMCRIAHKLQQSTHKLRVKATSGIRIRLDICGEHLPKVKELCKKYKSNELFDKVIAIVNAADKQF
jgi:hypothetical protein|tara:strand:- start:157 stop:375 length:219 start_codon:yes stop_codon:yes gene_type:complete